MKKTTSLATVAALAFLGGCNGTDGDGNGSRASSPSEEQAALAQESSIGATSVDPSLIAANDSIISEAASAAVATTDGSDAPATAGSFNFSNSGTVNVDLDAVDGLGNDRYPNATGTFTVTYSGTAIKSSPLGQFGEAHYDVTVDYTSDCTFTDPDSDRFLTIALGSNVSYSFDIDWEYVSDTDWHLDASTDLTIPSLTVNASRNGHAFSESVSGDRHGEFSMLRTADSFTVHHDVVADWDVTWTRDGHSHHAVWHRPSLDVIYITIDGVQFGPYTRAEVWKHFHCRIRDR